jgi:hypothetical protein
MSNYSKITRHPITGTYEKADYQDDWFGPHMYGVLFTSDKKIYPIEQVNNAQLKEFWAEDVLEAFMAYVGEDSASPEMDLLVFLEYLDYAYKARWERDPNGGEGAIENEHKKRGK